MIILFYPTLGQIDGFSVSYWVLLMFFFLKIRFYISQMLLFSVNGPKVGGVAPGAAIYIEGVTLRRLLFSLAKMDKCQI